MKLGAPDTSHERARTPALATRLGAAFHTRPEEGSRWGWALAATGLALVVRLIGLTRQSYWQDEVESVKHIFREDIDWLYVISRNVHGPLHKLLVYLWSGLFGPFDVSLRTLSALIGVATVPILYAFGRRVAGERAALWAAFILAINPFHLWYSQEVRGYILLMAFGILSTWAFLREIRIRSFRTAAVTVLSSVAVCLSSFGGMFVIAAHGAFATVAAWRRGYPLRRFVIIELFVLVLVTPYFIEYAPLVNVENMTGIQEVPEHKLLRGSHTFNALAPAHSLFAYSVGLTIGPSINEMHYSLGPETFKPHVAVMLLVAITFGVVGIAGWLGARRRPELQGFLVLWLVVPIVLTALLAVLNLKVYNVRYPAAGFGAWMLFLGLGFERLERHRAGRLAIYTAIALSLYSVLQLNTVTRYWKPDSRSAANLVLREGRPGDRVLIYTNPEPFEYYYKWVGKGPLDVTLMLAWHLAEPERFERFLDGVTAGEGRLWLIRHRSWYVDRADRAKGALDRRLRHLESWRFPELPVDLYECAGPPRRPP